MKILFLVSLLVFSVLSAPGKDVDIVFYNVPDCDMWCQIPDVRPGLQPCCEEKGYRYSRCKNEFEAMCGKRLGE